MQGTVKFFNERKGFGFITADDGKDYFVHISDLGEGISLNEGDSVTFEVEDGDRGPKAVRVSVGGAPTEEAPADEEEATEE